jgi:hypothetical protein
MTAILAPTPNIPGLRIRERTKEAPRSMSARYQRLMTRPPGLSTRNTLTGRAASHRLCGSDD